MHDNGNYPIHLGKVDVSPEEVGYNSARLETLDSLFQRLIRQEKLQCASYLLSRNGKIFASKSMGRLSGFDDRGDLMPDSIRRIASITKCHTAIAIAKLIEDGEIYLQQPVATILEEFDTPMHNDIEIFHLLTHTAGIIADPGYFKEPYQRGWWDGFNGEKDNWIKAMLAGPKLSKPGEVWNYSSAGYTILGEIVSRVSGMPFEEYVTKNILKPLSMDRSFFQVPEELHDQVCMIHSDEAERLKPKENKNALPSSSGGLYSNLYDLWKIGQLMLDNGTLGGQRILGRKTVEVMTSNLLSNVPAFHWGSQFKSYEQGFAWRITSRNFFSSDGTYGNEGAGRCALYVDPVEKMVAAYFVPTKLGWVPESVMNAQAVIWSGIQ